MDYLVFTDESGSWHYKKDDYYIRAWIGMTKDEYKKLKKVFRYYRLDVTELKYNKFKNLWKVDDNQPLFVCQGYSLNDINFKIVITITKPKHFAQREYNLIKAVSDFVESNYRTGDPTKKLFTKQVLQKRIEYIMFLTNFEAIHAKSAIERFATYIETSPNKIDKVFLIADVPQFLKDDWASVVASFKPKTWDIKIIDSAKEIGIQLADVVSGTINDVLHKDKTALDIYDSLFKKHMLVSYSPRGTPFRNPDLIFYQEWKDQDPQELNFVFDNL